MASRPAVLPGEAEIAIEDIAQGGAGVGRLPDGRVCFVPGVALGERVRVRLVREKKRFAWGRLLEVREPSPDRQDPPCPLFQICGGCPWQHLTYRAQLEYKGRILRGQLVHLGGIEAPPVEEAVPAPEPLAYRNNATFRWDPEHRALAFLGEDDRTLVPIPTCPILLPELDELRAQVEAHLSRWSDVELAWVTLRWSRAEGKGLVILHLAGGSLPPKKAAWLRKSLGEERVTGIVVRRGRWGKTVVLDGRGWLRHDLGLPQPLRVSAASFLQANEPLAGRMARDLRQLLPAAPEGRFLELYAGVGTLALHLADRFREGIAVEASSKATADARRNAAALGVENVAWVADRAERVMETLPGPVDVAVLDPPRRGADPAVLEGLLRLRPRTIAYISCHPGTLARDLKVLTAGGYRLRLSRVYDLFPQTPHVESLSLLEWAGA